jgi:hypothetical protein
MIAKSPLLVVRPQHTPLYRLSLVPALLAQCEAVPATAKATAHLSLEPYRQPMWAMACGGRTSETANVRRHPFPHRCPDLLYPERGRRCGTDQPYRCRASLHHYCPVDPSAGMMARKLPVIRSQMNPIAHEQRVAAARRAMFQAMLLDAKDG